MKIGFYGLTHLGLCYLAACKKKGFQVIGCDKNKTINLIKEKNHIIEPGLSQILKKNINFTSNLKDLINCDLIFISFDTPTNSKNISNYSLVIKAIKNLEKENMVKKNIVLLSQVYPGFTRKYSKNFDNFYHQVETLIFGNAINRALNPERIIIGYQKKNKNLINFYKKFNCPIIFTNYETSELIKISINLYLISNLTLTNILSEISEKYNANWDNIQKALHLDKRIGKYAYLRPGLGISSGNLERDLKTISKLSKNTLHKNYFENVNKNSFFAREWISRKFKKIKISKRKISVLGLTYKEDTSSIKNSASINFIKKNKKILFHCYDPVIKKINTKITNVILYTSINKCLENAKIILILTPWKKFIKKNLFNKCDIIIDPFSVLKEFNFKNKNILYIRKGIHEEKR